MAHGIDGHAAEACESRTFAKGIHIDEEERTILADGAADAGTELIAHKVAFVAAGVESVAGIEDAIAQVIVAKAVKCIGSAAGDDIHLSAGAAAIFGAIGVGGDFEFLNGVDRRLQVVAIDIGVVVVDAVEEKIVELLAGAVGVHGERAAGRQF